MPGTIKLNLDATDLSSGIYFYRLTTPIIQKQSQWC